MTDRDRVVHNFLNKYLRILVKHSFEIEEYSVGPLADGSVPFKLRASGQAEVKLSGNVRWLAQVDPLKPVPETSGMVIMVGSESLSPPHTVDDFLSLNEQGEFDLSEERFTKVLLDKIAELKSRVGQTRKDAQRADRIL